MSYDIHIVRTDSWLDSADNPITKSQVEELVASDPELTWSTDDWVDMSNDDGEVIRYFFIIWNGEPCFWWYRDEIRCSGPSDEQLLKMTAIAAHLDANVIGDDGEAYP
jgi:hypothetical protein